MSATQLFAKRPRTRRRFRAERRNFQPAIETLETRVVLSAVAGPIAPPVQDVANVAAIDAAFVGPLQLNPVSNQIVGPDTSGVNDPGLAETTYQDGELYESIEGVHEYPDMMMEMMPEEFSMAPTHQPPWFPATSPQRMMVRHNRSQTFR